MGFRVGDEYRDNPMSNRPGGVTVCVKETNGKIFEYDKIKNPEAYMRKIKTENPDFECWIKK